MRSFILQRDVDVNGVSGTGVVAEGVEFNDGTVALRWLSEWPTSVVFHERGIDAVRAVHGHGGKTKILFLEAEGHDSDPHLCAFFPDQCQMLHYEL